MPGSLTTPGRSGTRAGAPARVAFRYEYGVGARDHYPFAARWLAYAIPYRRFAAALTDDSARLGADVDRYSFIATDLHRLLLAGLARRTAIDRRVDRKGVGASHSDRAREYIRRRR